MRSFHDLAPGDLFRLGPILVSRNDVMEFRRRFGDTPGDPAQAGRPSQPVASPLHVMALMMGALFQELKALAVVCTGRPQIDELRFHMPVRALDRLGAEAVVPRVQVPEQDLHAR